MAEALAPLWRRLGGAREREVLRIAATISGGGEAAAFARGIVLEWAKRKSGGTLPKEAWDGQSFDLLLGGRTTLGARVEDDGADLWALRNDDPDKEVPGRAWTTEVVLGRAAAGETLLSLRLMLTTGEEEPDITPAVPGMIVRLAEARGLRVGPFAAEAKPRGIATANDLEELVAMLEAPERRLPIIALSGDERAEDPAAVLLDAGRLAQMLCGLAHVVTISAPLTYGLSDRYGKTRSVYHGAVRLYWPGFDAGADPYEHRLFLPETVRRDPQGCVATLCRSAAAASLRRNTLGREIVRFSEVQSAALRRAQHRAPRPTAEATDLAEAAEALIRSVEKERDEARNEADRAVALAAEAEERARAAETALRGATARIRQLEEALRDRGQDAASGLPAPSSWPELVTWCDTALAGRLALAPAARKGVKKALFRDVGLVARCLAWLATECRARRLSGGGALANAPIAPGIENAPCGGDTFRFDYQGRQLWADWHVKNGGNTRDPERCLRIYYAWDEESGLVIVADLPAHRRTGAS